MNVFNGGLHAAHLALLALLLAVPQGCRSPDELPVEPTGVDSAPTRLPLTAHVADPGAVSQLKEGFHAVEQSSWRWTARRFAFALGTPESTGPEGAVLSLRFALPDPVIEQLGQVTLTGYVGGVTLDSRTYSKSGNYIYSTDVPSPLLVGDTLRVEFELDRAMPPSEADQRELGIIVSSVVIEPK